MQRYIEQLISDLHKASWQVRPPHELWDDADPTYEVESEDMAYAEKYIYGQKEPISQITGIETEAIPAPDKLTQEQQALLAVELENLLQHFNFYLDFPESYPAHLRYPFIRNFWETEEVPVSFGESHIEFCDYEIENCPFEGYCNTCKEVAEERKRGKKIDNQDDIDWNEEDLPF